MPETDISSDVMTVAKLREALAAYPDDMPVVLAGDPEGNRFGEFHEATNARWWFDIGERADSDDEEADLVVCLWPGR